MCASQVKVTLIIQVNVILYQSELSVAMKKTMPGGLRRCSCLPWGSRRGDNIGTSARLPPKVAAWLILMMMLPRAWLDATLQLIERAQSGGHSCLHGIARSTDEHSEHDGYRVDGHAAGVLVRWRTKIAYGVLK